MMAKEKKWKATKKRKKRVAEVSGGPAIQPGYCSLHGAYVEAVQAEAEKKR